MFVGVYVDVLILSRLTDQTALCLSASLCCYNCLLLTATHHDDEDDCDHGATAVRVSAACPRGRDVSKQRLGPSSAQLSSYIMHDAMVAWGAMV